MPTLRITFLQILKLAAFRTSSQGQPVSAGEQYGCLGHKVEWGTKFNGNMKVKKVTKICYCDYLSGNMQNWKPFYCYC